VVLPRREGLLRDEGLLRREGLLGRMRLRHAGRARAVDGIIVGAALSR
jgi:hypothetical protein